jgi:hypothetical protein
MEHKFFKVVDNFLPLNFENFLEDIFTGKSNITIPLCFTPNITSSSSKEFFPSFSIEFYPSNINLSNLLLNVLYYFSFSENMYVTDIIRAKAITQLPSPNPGPNVIHTDTRLIHYVCLYYINDSDGDTILFNDKEEEIERITPKKGRMVLFDGSIKHCSSRPSNLSRSILNFDFTAEKL